MEREVSSMATLMVGILAIAAVIGIMMFTVVIGRDVQEDANEGITDVKDSISIDYVKELASGHIDSNMPAATAYNILKMYDTVIIEEASEYDDTVRNLRVKGSVLESRLSGRVNLKIKETKNGQYMAFVYRVFNTEKEMQAAKTAGQIKSFGLAQLNSKYQYK